MHSEDLFREDLQELIERLVQNLNKDVISEFEVILHMQFITERSEEKSKSNVCFANHNDELRDEYKEVFAPIDILDYFFAVLNSSSYGGRYIEFLKTDSLRELYPKNNEEFWQLVKLGAEIRETSFADTTKLVDEIIKMWNIF